LQRGHGKILNGKLPILFEDEGFHGRHITNIRTC
jgi:hypothetical protein